VKRRSVPAVISVLLFLAGVSSLCEAGAPVHFAMSNAVLFASEQDGASNGQDSHPLTDRERREKAYGKMLEGQRYFSSISRGDVESNLKAAQKAFQEAVGLDSRLVEAHVALAEVDFYLQDLDEAAAEGEKAKSLDPDNLGAQRVLSRIYTLKSGLREGTLVPDQAGKAIEALREVVRLDKNNAEGWALLGEFYRQQGKTDEAIDALKHWTAAPPTGDSRFYQVFTQGRELTPDAASARLAETLIAAGRPTEAVNAAQRALAMNPDKKEYGNILAQALDASSSVAPETLVELKRLSAQDPANTNLLRTLAHAQARSGSTADAASTLKAAINAKSNNSRDTIMLRLELAQVYSDALQYDNAIGVYEELLKSRSFTEGKNPPTEDEKHFAAAILQREIALQKSAERPREAMQTISRMKQILGPDDPLPYSETVALLRDEGKLAEALEASRTARQKFPDRIDIARQEAEALTALGRVDEAANLFKARLKGNINDFSLLLSISNFYSDAGRGKEAVEYAQKALALVPVSRSDLSTVALISLASAQERAGDSSGAETSLRRVLKEEPNNATALNNLGYFLVERNQNLDEAVAMIEKALRREPDNPSYMDSLGWAYFKLGKLDQAERFLADAARRSRTSATIQEHLGDLYAKQEKSSAAAASYRRAKTLATDNASIQRLDSKIRSAERR
jgi:tetratricopeptide (TPR) repeat protein